MLERLLGIEVTEHETLIKEEGVGWRTRAEKPVPRTLLVLIMLALALALPVVWPDLAHADTFTVKNTEDRGKGSLRKAITKANKHVGTDEIQFNIPGGGVKSINLASPLPDITDPVTIDGYTQPGAGPNTLDVGNNATLKIQLNGTNAGAGASGLEITGADSTIKGLVINRFDGSGIVIFGTLATNNKVEGNFIGTNADGTANLDNSDGVQILFAASNTVGGTAAEARNIISGNGNNDISSGDLGVFIRSGDGNEVLGNYIGTDKNGTTDLGNTGPGVGVLAGADNIIGGTAAGARNIISGNGDDGIIISGSTATGNRILGNFVGTDAIGNADLGNSGDGVSISFTDNTVGGKTSGAGNRIAFNEGDGVLISGSAAGTSILSNSIFSNGGLGIDLNNDGVTANDTDDLDTGANGLQNFPVIASARNTSGLTFISGTLNSNPDQDLTVQCFVAVPDPSGHGEGQIPAGEDNVTTDANGDASFACISPVPQPGLTVAATATKRIGGDTSEFSRIVGVAPVP